MVLNTLIYNIFTLATQRVAVSIAPRHGHSFQKSSLPVHIINAHLKHLCVIVVATSYVTVMNSFGLRTTSITVTTAIMLLCALPGAQAIAGKASTEKKTSPAVEASNFDLSVGGGVLDNDQQAIFSGTASFPLGHSYGAQLDGSLTTGEGSDRGGIAGHIFYRDPSSHLIGGTVMWGRVGNYDVTRVGPEAEFYLGNTSLYVNGGWQDEDRGSTGYGTASVSHYITDNWVVSANAMGFSDVRGLGVGTEWKPESTPFSIYVEAGDDNRSAGYAIAGLRMSFGTQGASLKDRHRRFDPPNIVHTFSAAQSQSVAPTPPAMATPASPPPPPPPPVCVPPPGCICDGAGNVSCI